VSGADYSLILSGILWESIGMECIPLLVFFGKITFLSSLPARQDVEDPFLPHTSVERIALSRTQMEVQFSLA